MNPPPTIRNRLGPAATGLLLAAVAAIPISLIWDFSWESTVGVDRFWAPAHTLGFLAVGLAGLLAMTLPAGREGTVRLAGWPAPLGAWLVAWGALAFATAVLFNRWWQSAYGLAAGLWHPPQILQAASSFAVALGAWLLAARGSYRGAASPEAGAFSVALAGGIVLTLVTAMTLTLNYPNRQHAASFFKLACATYPFVLAALVGAARGRWPATTGAALYTAMVCAMVWVLPLVPGRPLTGPIHNPLDHLAPPPFPLLLLAPALAMDAVTRWFLPPPSASAMRWGRAVTLGVVFFLVFLGAQWTFAEFLLTDLADNRFFAGGGRHWPFFLKIDPIARTQFWPVPGDSMTPAKALAALGLAVVASRIGLWFGEWMARVRR